MKDCIFLGQYTSGKAKEVINGCLQGKSEGSYKEAKGLLKRQFGDPFKIADAHITKLSSWQPIRPNDGSDSGPGKVCYERHVSHG